ncbi:MAG: FAD-dependent oxidoreductase [Thermodesulfobacteriota bacterium]
MKPSRSPDRQPPIQEPLLISRSHMTSESNKTGSWRYLMPRYHDKTAPCSVACPAGEDIGRIEMLNTQGFFKEAWETILLENPFPAVCGRICFHPCESVCNRKRFDEAVSIRSLERFVADTAQRYKLEASLQPAARRGEKIAVVGAGPAGLAAAHFLTLLGYACDVFEALPEPGGILRWGLPRYRLPLEALAPEIERIRQAGVSFFCGQPVRKDFFRTAAESYAAIFMTCGLGRMPRLGIPGEESAGVGDGFAFLRAIVQDDPPVLSGLTAVIGGGNTAVDVARCARRLGAPAVILYRRRRQDMPAFGEEIEMALSEGVELMELCVPVNIQPVEGGLGITLQQMKPSTPDADGRTRSVPDGKRVHTITAAHVFKAIGFEAGEPWHLPPPEKENRLRLRHSVLTMLPDAIPVVYCGDPVTDIQSVVHAVASAKEGAMALDVLFRKGFRSIPEELSSAAAGQDGALSMECHLKGLRSSRSPHVVAYEEINIDYFEYAPRLVQPRLLQSERLESFAEIDLKISASMAIREAERCFNCGLCNQCDNCRIFCPDLAVKLDDSLRGRGIDYDYCKGCGICVVECPRNAMVLEEEKE